MLFTCLCLLHLHVLTCLKLSILNSSFMVPEFLSAAEENPCPVEDFLWFLLIKKKKYKTILLMIKLNCLTRCLLHRPLYSLTWRTGQRLARAAHNGPPDTPAGLRLWHGLLGGYQRALGGAAPAGD